MLGYWSCRYNIKCNVSLVKIELKKVNRHIIWCKLPHLSTTYFYNNCIFEIKLMNLYLYLYFIEIVTGSNETCISILTFVWESRRKWEVKSKREWKKWEISKNIVNWYNWFEWVNISWLLFLFFNYTKRVGIHVFHFYFFSFYHISLVQMRSSKTSPK